MEMILPPKKKRSPVSLIKKWAAFIAVVLLYVWTFMGIDIDWGRAFERMTSNFTRVIPKLFNPDWSAIGKVWTAMVETLYIAFAGSLMAAIIAIPLGFLAASNMTNSKVLTTIGKWILSAIRAFPDLILAILFVVAVGPNPFAGVLAIAIGSTGMLGKLYSEVLESIDFNIVEAMEASGANKIQILFHGIIPQIIPEFLSYAIYRFEIDVRASTILGIVGAGGIGTLIQFAQMNRNWEQMGLILLVIIIVVTIIDFVSSAIRRRIV
ncbi:phosphonate ABC transporter, permease protein PhnE [Rossellomorea vietnamensis]|uniref:Phosphonate ABC transporter, permease protein PhnE n=2 Tax=Rossellomorea TaxID=2837508 RepID=A0A5D4KN50_9BACI|nr:MULTISPECIES: phosphonate ABC transporter, permease protein PhnE [Rossellomorea]TYR77733.1 phosphonate ABC transporter, permease protein PhnE [Rossellomorea vietnamensis]TYS83436.1 phosphonate ABC transporter, permease protein PhnE [Rossellomorea aquimaris]